MMTIVMSYLLFFIVLLALGIPLGFYIYRVMTGQKVFMTRIIAPVEGWIYRFIGKPAKQEMTAKKYIGSIVAFSLFSFLAIFLLMLFQGVLPLNPAGLKGTSIGLAFNTAISFVTNTNWQAYSGETTLSPLTQSLALTVQNFASAAVGIAVLFILLRGFVAEGKRKLGNFWQDITRITLYLLIPVSFVIAILLMSQGVVQTFQATTTVTELESGLKAVIPLGLAASQIAIKQLGTNGGGYFGANSAMPFENPTVFSNFVENIAILLIPVALIMAFGLFVKNRKQGRTIFIVSFVLLILALIGVTLSEHLNGPVFDAVAHSGSMEGKEARFGIGWSSLWAVSTTAASNGSINAMLDSFTPLGGLIPMFLMQLGEIVFGGAGSGLYGMIAFVLLTVFIAGLLVGRTPEYLGKKIEPANMKMVCLVILTPPLLVLIGSMSYVLMSQPMLGLVNTGPHAFSEVLYTFSSLANNNGSAFAGLAADTPFMNSVGGIIMLLVRFIPMFAIVVLAHQLGQKKCVASTDGTLSTTDGTFTGMLLGVILLIGALSFLPALALGPLADYFMR